MLTQANRLTSGSGFTAAVRGGVRAGSATLVVHLLVPPPTPAPGDPADIGAPRVGLVVGRAVGGSVGRNRVKRRLRHLVRPHLPSLPAGTLVVLRALPAAGTAGSDRLAADLDHALGRALRRTAERSRS